MSIALQVLCDIYRAQTLWSPESLHGKTKMYERSTLTTCVLLIINLDLCSTDTLITVWRVMYMFRYRLYAWIDRKTITNHVTILFFLLWLMILFCFNSYLTLCLIILNKATTEILSLKHINNAGSTQSFNIYLEISLSCDNTDIVELVWNSVSNPLPAASAGFH